MDESSHDADPDRLTCRYCQGKYRRGSAAWYAHTTELHPEVIATLEFAQPGFVAALLNRDSVQ